jgi:hypothetical protein
MNENKNDQRNKKMPSADTGNASNPSPRNKKMEPLSNNQLLGEKAEKYLRESANIEDEPDPQEQKDAEEVFKTENTNTKEGSREEV